jgi:hypothetical protein
LFIKKCFILFGFLSCGALAGLNSDSRLVKAANELWYQGDRHWHAEPSIQSIKYPVAPEYSEFISDGLELLSLGGTSVFAQKLSSILVAAVRVADVLLRSYPKMRGPALRLRVSVDYDKRNPIFRDSNGYDWLAVNPDDPRYRNERGGGGDSDPSPFKFWHNPFDDAAKGGLGLDPWLVSGDIAALLLNQLHKLQSLRH